MVFGTLLAVQIFLNFTIFFVDSNYISYAIWVWFFTFCEGAIFIVMPNIMKRIFGSKTIGMYGYFASFSAASSLITLLMDHLFLSGSLLSYEMFFVFNGVLSLLALIILIFFFDETLYVPKCFRNNQQETDISELRSNRSLSR